MTERKYVLRKGIEGIIPAVFGESFHFFEDFSKRIAVLPREAYLPWNTAMDFFETLLTTSDNDTEKYLYKVYLIPVNFHGIGKVSMADRDYSIANNFMIISFVNGKKRKIIIETKRQSEIKKDIDFSSSAGKYVLLLKEEEPETIPTQC
ncbi:MAG TPA: hypothetical protein VG982_01705 [Candidatus Paceibacterota bacterium]|nr:hypothetical protein [Candidatus Paceibacterota bacterium]